MTRIGMLDMQVPVSDGDRLDEISKEILSSIYKILRRNKGVPNIEITRKMLAETRASVLEAYSLGAVRAHVGSKSIATGE